MIQGFGGIYKFVAMEGQRNKSRRRQSRQSCSFNVVIALLAMMIVLLECGSAVAACSFFRRNLQQQSDNAPPAAGQAQAAGQGMAPPSSTTAPVATGTGSGATIYVDIAGTGNFNSLQAAVNSIPAGNPQRVTIVIKPGTYVEKVTVPTTLPYLTIQGGGAGSTCISWNAIASDIGPDGHILTAYNTATVIVLANNFIAKDISFKNTAPPPPAGIDGKQGAAFRISGDMAAFYNCGFYGAQDTLCDDIGRHYFKNCYVEGSIDFIFGNGQSLYTYSTFNSIAQSYGAVAAQDRQGPTDPSGFTFLNCKVTGTGNIFLGRAMGPYSRIIYVYSYFDNIINPLGWDNWSGDTSKNWTVTFGQFQCAGPGSTEAGRVPWSHEFAQADVQPFYELTFINGNSWLNEV